MSVSPELMYAILSMDSYNRGYGSGIGGADGLGSSSDGSVQIGTATLTYNLDNAGLATEGQAAGFYAVAYSWNGQTVISYRGTDSAIDGVTGFPTGAGSVGAEQGKLAAQFFKAETLHHPHGEVRA